MFLLSDKQLFWIASSGRPENTEGVWPPEEYLNSIFVILFTALDEIERNALNFEANKQSILITTYGMSLKKKGFDLNYI